MYVHEKCKNWAGASGLVTKSEAPLGEFIAGSF